ncbi:hypothetical protein AB0G78_06365 [Streptomyces venezuelae]|nr:hypothetical protein [Streptomyces venezuelae]
MSALSPARPPATIKSPRSNQRGLFSALFCLIRWGYPRSCRTCDRLFIDEGFGSLDDQTLDEVLDVLDSLRERDRSVGIVSHVADLRRRVHAQLEVVKGRAGSAVRRRGGA